MRLRNCLAAGVAVLTAIVWLHAPACPGMEDLPDGDLPGIVNVVEQPKIDETQGANQTAFPYYYGAGMPDEGDLVQLTDAPSPVVSTPPPLSADLAAPIPELVEGGQSAFPDYYSGALLQQSKGALEIEINRARVGYNLIKSYCDSGDTDEAWEIYGTMPDFADNSVINDFRAEAASLLILNLCRDGELPRARELYSSLPLDIPGDEAMQAKARAIINLTTYYIINESYNDAYLIIMDIGNIKDRGDLNNEIFKLMARMIPYLDNADETEKAYAVYRLLQEQIQNPETARLFADHFPGLPRYFLQYAKRTVSNERREQRLEFLRHIFDSLSAMEASPDIALLRVNLAGDLVDFYTEIGELEKARKYYDYMHGSDKRILVGH